MPAPYPQFIPEAFAISAAPAFRNTIPTAPIGTQRASFDLGFPPLTMTPVVAGGKPMLGPDMNGVLYMLSTHTVYQQSGMLYRWDAAVVAAIGGGYASGTVLGSTDGSTVWVNLVAGNASNPDAGGAGWIPLFAYGPAAIGGLTGGVRVLTPAESAKGVIVVSGALVANQQIIVPTTYQTWLIINNTSGGFALTVKTAAGTGVIVPAGGYAAPTGVYSNGVNVYPTVSPTVLPTDVNPTANTIPLRDNVGYGLFATPPTNDNTTRAATTAMVQAVATAVYNAVASQLLGRGQAWIDVTGSRNFFNVEFNNTGREIQVSVSCSLPAFANAVFWVDGVPVAQNTGGATSGEGMFCSPVIPIGASYYLTGFGGAILDQWSELR